MGNKKTKRLAGQLLKSYGLSKRFTNRKRYDSWQAKFIADILRLHNGDLLFEEFSGCNHPTIGFLALNYTDNNKHYSTVLHPVYEGMILGMNAFSVVLPVTTAETYDAEKHGPVYSDYFYNVDEHDGIFVPLREKQ